jgi:hypothetical protein
MRETKKAKESKEKQTGGGQRRPNRARLREIGRMFGVRPSWWGAEIGGGGRRCLVEEGGGKSFGGLGERVEGKGLVVGGGESDSYQLDGGGRLW